MSTIEYNKLVNIISQRLDERNALSDLRIMCRHLVPSSEDNIQNAFSLFTQLEGEKHLGIDRLKFMKELLINFSEWSLLDQVKRFERKRKEFNSLLDEIIGVLDELNGVERLIPVCRETIPEERVGQIQDVRSLFEELENQNNLGVDSLDTLKAILIETEQNDLLNKVEEFEDRRNNEVESERGKAERAAAVSSALNTLKGALDIKVVSKVVVAGIAVVTIREVWRRCSTYDQLVTAFQSCVLPAGAYLVKLTEGSVCFTVQAENLSALNNLWNLYQNGTLERRLYDFLVTDEVRERAGGEKIEVDVIIDEQEYEKACLELIREAQAATVGNEKRIRRNSDSAMYLRQKEETTAIFKQKPEWWKAHQAGEMLERPDEPKISQRMDPEKLALVQKFLKDADDTRSTTTKTSDSDYWTQTVESEFAESETSDSLAIYLEDQVYDGIRNPYVLIINNVSFVGYGGRYRENKALYDRDHVRRFVGEAGFRSVVEHFDLESREIFNKFQEARRSVELHDHDSVICIIMSLGYKGHILGVDHEPIAVDKITSLFRGDMCPKLRNKPKLFFLEVNHFFSYRSCDPPPDEDFLIALSSPGVRRYPLHMLLEAELSRQSLGSPFISLLMKILRANSHKEDLMTMLARVNKAMSDLNTPTPDEDARRQLMSYQLSSLTKKVYFPNFRKTTPAISE